MVKVNTLRVTSTAAPYRRGLLGLGSGWVPALLVVAFATVTLVLFGVPLTEVATFAAYVGLCITLPGMLWWRALSGSRRCLAEDLAAGTALGYAMEVLAYIPARWAGLPQLFLLWPLITFALFAAIPKLRRRIKGARPQPRPAWWPWTMAGIVAFTIALSAAAFFRDYGLTWPENAMLYVDLPWHLSLAGELKHHLPAMVPYVFGEPLFYHWFVYADLAATSWATGIELQTLLFRLSLMPMIAAFTVLIALAARRITGRWWSGPAALAIMFAGAAPNPYAKLGELVPLGGGTLPYLSPTQAFGALLFVPLVLVLVDLMRRPDGYRGRWALAIVLLVALSGAKATFLPIALAGLAAVVLTRVIVRRKLHVVAALAGLMCGVCLLVSHLLLYRGEGQGMRVAPLHLVEWAESRLGAALRLLTVKGDMVPYLWPLALAIFLLGWAAVWGGMVGLLRDRRLLHDPAVPFLAGMGASALGATLVFGHPGVSELFFLRSASPYLAILAVYGLAVVMPVRRPWLVVIGAAGAGVAVMGAVQLWLGASRPTGIAFPAERVLPHLVLLAALLLAATMLVRAQRGALVWAVVPIMALGFGLHAARSQVTGPIERMARDGTLIAELPERKHMPRGGMAAARWLRAHSNPGDLVAANTHCRRPYRPLRRCDNRHFWVSAYSERRVLIEGWGYANGVDNRAALSGEPEIGDVLYTDPERLVMNDAAFLTPSAETVGNLQRVHGVRWLFVDERFAVATEELGKYAQLRYVAGRCRVYELTATSQVNSVARSIPSQNLLKVSATIQSASQPESAATEPSGASLENPK